MYNLSVPIFAQKGQGCLYYKNHIQLLLTFAHDYYRQILVEVRGWVGVG